MTVNNVNDAPDDILFNGLTSPTLLLPENSPANTVVATLSTHDVDNSVVPGTDSFIYTLANNFGGAFKIVGNQIQVQNGALLDFEVRSTASISALRSRTVTSAAHTAKPSPST